MRSYIILILFTIGLFSRVVYAQQSKIDSLTVEFNNTTTDSLKAAILAQIGVAAYYTDFKLASAYNDSLINFSKNRVPLYEGIGLRMKGTLSLIDGNYVNAEKYYNQSLKLFKDINDKGYQGALYSNLATLYARQNQIEKADSLYLKAIKVLENTENNQLVNCYINLGINALNANKLKTATAYFIKTLNRADSTSNVHYQFYAHNQLGIVYLKRQLIDKAEYNFKKALTIGEKIDDKTGLANIYNSLGSLEDQKRNSDLAIDYFKKAKDLFTKVNDTDELPKAQMNLGRQYQIIGNYTKSKSNYQQAILITQKNNDSSKLVTAKLNIATLYLEQNKKTKALEALKDAERYMPSIPDDDYSSLYKRISTNFKKIGDKSNALDYLEKYTTVVDSVYNSNDLNAIAEIETKYQTEKKEKENLQLKADKAAQTEQLALESKRKWQLGGGLATALLGLGVFGFYYRRNKKQKETIETLQKELHHRVKNNLTVIDSFIEITKEEFPEEKITAKLTDLQNRIDSINAVHEQLYIKDDVTSLNLKKYINQLANNVSNSFTDHEITIEQNIDEQLAITADKSFSIGLIVNEFLTNSFKYAFNDSTGKINIYIEKIKDNYSIQLTDNGKGLPEDFDIKTTESFGLRFITLLTQQLNGSYQLTNDNGVLLSILIPKS